MKFFILNCEDDDKVYITWENKRPKVITFTDKEMAKLINSINDNDLYDKLLTLFCLNLRGAEHKAKKEWKKFLKGDLTYKEYIEKEKEYE